MKRGFNNPHEEPQSSPPFRKRQNRTTEPSYSNIIGFRWDSTIEPPIINMDKTLSNANEFTEAFQSCQTSFHESLRRMIRHLKQHGILIEKPSKENMITHPQRLNSSYIAELLNATDCTIISLIPKFSPDSSTFVQGPLLLHALCELFKCRIYLFSTRRKAVVIHPADEESLNLPTFCILQHSDSYLQRTTYFPLKVEDDHKNTLIVQDSEASSVSVALKRAEGERKPRSQRTRIGATIDGVIVSFVRDEVNKFYKAKWDKFIEKEGRRRKDIVNLIEEFKETLPKKSFPNGLVQEVKAKIEFAVKNNNFDFYKEADLPKSGTWLHNKLSRIKQEGTMKPIETFVNDFLASLRSEHDDNGTLDEPEEEIAEEDDDVYSGSQVQIGTVSRSLKSVINERFSYSSLLSALERLQNDCKKSLSSLSSALGILIDIILSGEALQDLKMKDDSIKLEDFDLSGDSIFTNDPDVVVWNKDGVKLLQKENFFSKHGFWTILSFCVGRKMLHKKNNPILSKVNERMGTEDVFSFKTTPALQAACNQYYVNFNNMWSENAYRQDLRVAITLLLRINLARKRFFKKKESNPKIEAGDEKEKSKSKKLAKKSFLMNQIFQVLLKKKNGNVDKLSALEKMVRSLFAPREEQVAKDNRKSKTDLKIKDTGNTQTADDLENNVVGETEDEDSEDEEDILDADLTASTTTDAERDLTSKEINALLSVSIMLCGADNIDGKIQPGYLKKQLYLDKQESISDQALLICCKIVNLIRKISIKGTEEASFLACYSIRNLRNVLVNFAGKNTRYTKRKLFPDKDDKSSQSVLINHSTLYLLFQQEYNIFDPENNPFTSYQDIQSDRQKQAVFSNFLNWQKIQRILEERKLEPSYLIGFNNQYDLILHGKKPPLRRQVKGVSGAEQKDPSVKPSLSELRTLNEKIKADKKEYRTLVTTLKVEEQKRMDLGREFRSRENKKKIWDAESYSQLKLKRSDCDELYDRMQQLSRRIKTNQSQMYLFNKALHGQEIKKDTQKIVASTKLLSQIRKGNALIQGIDPGIVTTASINCVAPSTLFNSINRFQLLEEEKTDLACQHQEEDTSDFAYDLTAKRVNQAVLSTHHRAKREKKQKESKSIPKKDLDRKKTTRKIRLDKFYRKYFSDNRTSLLKLHDIKKGKGSLISFLGNWSRHGYYIRGHERRSLKPAINRLKSVQKDGFYIVDECKSTITCNSCFSITTKQLMRVGENKRKRIKGAVVCNNKECPRRKKFNSTTTNRDQNGAKNIALIGFSQLVSVDGSVLPPFSRHYYTSKYNLSINFTGTRVVTSGSPPAGGK